MLALLVVALLVVLAWPVLMAAMAQHPSWRAVAHALSMVAVVGGGALWHGRHGSWHG